MMRIFSKILSIFLTIASVIGIAFCIILAVSSSTVMTFTNNEASRRKLFYTAYYKIDNSKEITLVSKTPYNAEEQQVAEDKITCSVKEENNNMVYTCSMISKLYDKDSKLIRTSYFPGDDYKYTKVEGEEKGTKTYYQNANLSTYFNNLLKGVINNLSLLPYDNKTIEDYFVGYDFNINFDFSTFSLSKDVAINYTVSEKKQDAKLSFDKNDYLTNINLPTNKSSISIDYKSGKLAFPALTGYIAV